MQWRFLGRTFYLSKALVVFVAGAVCVALAAGGYFVLSAQTDDAVLIANSTPGAATDAIPATTAPSVAKWDIYIVGAVKHPGVYSLEEGALVYDAIDVAGGLLQSVDPETVNMVQELQDNLMLQILTEEERVAQDRTSSLVLTKNNTELSGSTAEKININSATKEALMTLPGIGEIRAESIIAYREEHGSFATIEDIMLVSGIKESAFAKIKDRITT